MKTLDTFKVDFSIGDKKFMITPYTTKTEKDLLLMGSFDLEDIDTALEILDFYKINDVSKDDLSDNEKIAILYKYREISIGDEIDFKYKCKHCGTSNDGIVSVSDIVKPGIRNDKNIKKLNKELNDDNLQDFIIPDIDVDELEIDEYDKLFQKVKDNQISLDFTKTCSCLKCSELTPFILNNKESVIEHLSEDTLMSLYKTYNDMIFFGKYSKADIDSMYPFERSIFVGLLNKTKEELSK